MRAELIQLHQRIQRTMIYVTHDQLEAMTMSDRIAVMQGGTLQQFGTPDEVYSRPVNRFVAGFIGTPSMNLIEGTLSRGDTGVVFSSSALTLTIDRSSIANDVFNNGDSLAVTLGFRPDDIIFGDEGEEARVSVVEPTGHEVIVIFDLHGTEIVGRISPDIRLKSGEVVRLSPSVNKLHFFDGRDGSRLNANRD
jgi:multiple sugar transport system ATP-binding protein